MVLIHLCHVSNAWQEEQRVFSNDGREEWEQVLKEAEERAREWKIDLQRPSLSFGEVPVCAENPLRNLYISVEGEVSPCVYLNPPVPSPFKRIFQGREVQVEKVNFGNVFQEPFDRVWENPEYVEFRDCFARRKAHFDEMFASLWEPDRSKRLEAASSPAPPGPCQTCYKMLRL